MTKETGITPATFALTLLAILTMALGAGCADTSSAGGGKSNDDFEIRAMIAADRQQMQAMDERLRRMESQIQDLVHASPTTAEASAPAVTQQPSPAAAAAAPPLPAGGPPALSGPMGAPPAPGGPMGVPPAPNVIAPGGEVVPPGAAATPTEGAPGAVAAGTAAPGAPEGVTIASAPAPEASAAPPPTEGSSAEGEAQEGAAPEGAANDEGEPEAGTTESGNPEAQAPPNVPAPPGAPAGTEGAPAGGEEVASAPPSSPPENAPAALPPARWPDDLSRELQSAGSAKGGAGNLYRSGLDAMKNRDYSAAVQNFEMIQKKYPHSDLTEPAAYFSASALDEMGKYDQAILQYNDLVMRYPSGKYAGEALLREAQAFVQINDKVDARLTLQKLVNEHPGTPQATSASAMMKSLESD